MKAFLADVDRIALSACRTAALLRQQSRHNDAGAQALEDLAKRLAWAGARAAQRQEQDAPALEPGEGA